MPNKHYHDHGWIMRGEAVELVGLGFGENSRGKMHIVYIDALIVHRTRPVQGLDITVYMNCTV